MNAHYVYLLKSKDDGRLYIGDRTAPHGNPYTDVSYKSSCKVVSKQYKQNCMKRVLKTFNTREEAKAFEIMLHTKYDVGINPRFFNGAKQTSTKFDTSGITPPHTKTEEWKNKCRAYNTTRTYNSKPHSEETKKQISATWTKKYAEGYIPSAKKQHSEESIAKMKQAAQRLKGPACEHPAFKPWFIKYPSGDVVAFYTISKREKSLQDGLPSYAYEAACTHSKGVTALKQGRLKNYIIGNIVDDIVCST